MERLIQTLRAVGKPPEIFESPEGSTALILPHGGRILGLFAPGSNENFFWTHPALERVDTARTFYDSGQWQNSGGDRTWLAPEVDLFFPDFPGTSRYWQPRELDPGNYELIRTPEGTVLVNRLSLTLSRSRRQVVLEIRKLLAPAPNPLRHERILNELEGPAYAGYCLLTSLELLEGDGSARVGIWNLLQMPHGGESLVPTHAVTEPRVFFGTIPEGDLKVESNLIRYRMRAAGAQKIGIRAVAATGRAGYMYQTGDQVALVIRNFSVDPSAEYVDVPRDDPADVGYAVQACNVNSELGSFSELEYHAPAIGAGRTRYADVCQVWAFSGSPDDILAIARALLSSDA